MKFQTIKNVGHLIEAVVANLWYGFPSRNLVMIGVTGTDGKTTTSSIVYQILRSAGKKTAMISTVGAYIGDTVYDVGFHVTTPSSFAVQRYLRQAVDQGITHVVLEVTSHSLDQNRVWGIHFLVGVLTNITHEHLDYHETYGKYLEAKAMLLQRSDVAVINADDNSYHSIVKILARHVIIPYGKGKNARETFLSFPFTTSLQGEYNHYNALAAAIACREVGIPRSQIEDALMHIQPPKGRREVVYDTLFRVIVDFAHTPNAFHVLLPEIRKEAKGRVIHVFGSASKRDTTKRPLMGKESSAYSDIIILTAEDPRNEPVEKICKEIATGITRFKECREDFLPKTDETRLYYIIPDRKKAIEKAIALSKKGDVVVVTGKSHETSMNYGKGEEPWNEFETIATALSESKVENIK